MADAVSIANEALGELEEHAIQSFEDGTAIASLCQRMYGPARDMALELHPWNFAKYYARLARSGESIQTDQWQYMYTLDTAVPYVIRVRGINGENGLTFEVGQDRGNNRVLYTNEGTVSIEYTGRNENLNNWSPIALQVLTKLMASKMAKAITGQNSVEQLKMQEAMAFLPLAQGADGREGTPTILRANNLLVRARHRHGSSLWTLGIREI